jgi:L-histidine N-alpha-methyltransferase
MMQVSPSERLQFTLTESATAPEPFAESVRDGLSAPSKHLSCRWFYNRRGSELFERICELEEYYLTRTERSILANHAGEIAALVPRDATLVELGSGSSAKTRLLIEAMHARSTRVRYCPIDVSQEMLYHSAVELLEPFPRLHVQAVAAEYIDGLHLLDNERNQPRLILFLGSTLGNFVLEEARDFLTAIRRTMAPEDRLLLGTDLKKAREIIEPAYNDAAGVTAAFNRNLLVRINDELGGRFDPSAFDHHAPYVEALNRVEMNLVSRVAQEVPVAALERVFCFGAGERIHTEFCHKYSLPQVAELAAGAGLAIEQTWSDPRSWFALSLLAPLREAMA